ncbi:stem cell self-renewal protein Piwi [Purpureocillium lavendulum]|uniref:Stem cell self-renewal protein Piwi n=1 Tax=Purpureocillium lavendulum TaxID=1247861 RepID=A0AB34FRD3_9HYPO|nr:stem cell self-renewal protein Piwi [Purpureocillium lavendulum]
MFRSMIAGTSTAMVLGITASMVSSVVWGTATLPFVVFSSLGFALGSARWYMVSSQEALLQLRRYPALLRMHVVANFPWMPHYAARDAAWFTPERFAVDWVQRSVLVAAWLSAQPALEELQTQVQANIVQKQSYAKHWYRKLFRSISWPIEEGGVAAVAVAVTRAAVVAKALVTEAAVAAAPLVEATAAIVLALDMEAAILAAAEAAEPVEATAAIVLGPDMEVAILAVDEAVGPGEGIAATAPGLGTAVVIQAVAVAAMPLVEGLVAGGEDEAAGLRIRNSPRLTADQLSSMGGTYPSPDPSITALEDMIVGSQGGSLTGLATQLGKITLQSGSTAGSSGAASMDLFPLRPAFGTTGRPVSLWTNYFRINANPTVLFRYHLEFVQVASETIGDDGQTESTSATREVKGRKLHLAVEAALKTLRGTDKSMMLATEYKSQLISLKKLNLAENPFQIRLPVETSQTKVDVIDVTVHGPSEAPLHLLLNYMASMRDRPDDGIFPKYPDAVDALNVILGHGPRSKLNDVSAIGSSRFFPFDASKATANLNHDGHLLMAARGFFQSARIGTGRLLLNANVTHGVFRVSGKMDKLFEGLELRPVMSNDRHGLRIMKAVGKFMPKTRVWADFMLADGRKVRKAKTIHGLVSATELLKKGKSPTGDKPLRFSRNFEYPGPKEVEFWLEVSGNGRYISVYDYFLMKYKKQLKDLPLVNLGRADKPTLFPAEMIEIQPGQSVKAKLTMSETTAMLDIACRTPYANALSNSGDARNTLGLDDESLTNFGVTVDKSLLTVHGRVLNIPMLSLMTEKKRPDEFTPRDGNWNLNGRVIARPGRPIERWTYLDIMKRTENPASVGKMKNFAAQLIKTGIPMATDPVMPPHGKLFMTRDEAMGGSLHRFFTWAQAENIQYILIILPEKDSSGLYPRIKTLADCEFGIHTSLVLAKHMGLNGPSPQYAANVGLKVNLKMGGLNHRLKNDIGLLREGKTMVAGYDVTHPTNMPERKDGREAPSLVGLVASIDKDVGQWPATSWEQSARQEILSDTLVEAFKTRLDLWHKHNRSYPESVIIFRDGVSEGQFPHVLEQELPSIRKACADKCGNRPPKLTIVVSVKRHQTRFYPTSTNDMSKSGNVVNGTVVDRGITQARYWDFFLTAHHALKGTARPAHYTVLLDEIFRDKYKANAANELERLTHELCYLFGRATKAVSICPPAYYADIVCERARAHRPEIFDADDASSVASMSTIRGTNRQVHVNLKDTMYYI